MTCYARACQESAEKRKDIMLAAQALMQASKETGTNDKLLSAQLKSPKTTVNV